MSDDLPGARGAGPVPKAAEAPAPLTTGRKVSLGALCAAASAALCVGVVSAPLAPLPILYAVHRLGLWGGVATTAAAAAALFELHTGLGAVFLLNFGLLGLAAGEGVRRRVGFTHAVVGTVAAAVLANGAALLMESRRSDTDLRTFVAREVERGFASTRALMEGGGAEGEGRLTEEERARLGEAEVWIVRVMPSMMVAATAMATFLNLLLARRLFRSGPGGEAFEFGPLRLWRAPDWVIWVLIAAGFVLAEQQLTAAEGAEWTDVRYWALNVLVVTLTAYYFQGLAILAYYLGKSSLPPVLRGLAYLLAATQQALVVALAAVGMFDLWADFRRLKAREAGGPDRGA